MKVSVVISDDLQKKLSRCAQIDTVAPRMLDAAAPIVIEAVRKRLSRHSTAGAHQSKTYTVKGGRQRSFSWRQTGSLAASLIGEKPGKAKDGSWIKKLTFYGYDEKGVADDIKANQIEYGNSSQPAQPFRVAALNDCRDAVEAKMQEVFTREVGLDEP